MTPHPTHSTEEETLGEEIMKEIDFLCDHWVEGDDKSPYRFGGWREEVQVKLVEIFNSKLTLQKQSWMEEVKKLGVRPIYGGILGKEDYQRGFTLGHENGYVQAIKDVLSTLSNK